jgi:ATP synthase subunit b
VQIAEKILHKELSGSAEQTQLINSLLDEVASSNGTESK